MTLSITVLIFIRVCRSRGERGESVLQLRGHHIDHLHLFGVFQRDDLSEGSIQELDLHDRVHRLGRQHHLHAAAQVV